jgi:hypothetical protein
MLRFLLDWLQISRPEWNSLNYFEFWQAMEIMPECVGLVDLSHNLGWVKLRIWEWLEAQGLS